MELQIRKALERDVEELFTLNELFNGTGSNTKENIENSIRFNQQEIVLVAVVNNECVGFICGQIFKSMCYDAYYGHISELFVKEEYRRKGIAKQLMYNMEEEFKKNQIFYFQLFTGAENTIAQNFYCFCGYRKSEELMYRKHVGS